MPAYRLYRFDGAGKITSGEWIAADSDDEATAYVRDKQVLRGELWEKDRLVARFPAQVPK